MNLYPKVVIIWKDGEAEIFAEDDVFLEIYEKKGKNAKYIIRNGKLEKWG